MFVTPVIYLAYDVTSVEHHRLQTWLMRFGGGLAIAPVALAVLWALVRRRGARRAARRRGRCARRWSRRSRCSAPAASSASRSTAATCKIPAHYHGCIVGVTIALMGVAYWLLPRLGFAAPPPRLATWQP